MYSLAVRMRDTDLPPAHAAAVNSSRMSRASFLVGSPMMRDLSGASSGSDRESYTLASVFLPLRRMGSGLMSSPWRSWWSRCRSLANTRRRVPAGFAGFSFGSIRPTDVPRLPVYVSRSRLTVRMDFHGTRMRSCGVCRRGPGGPSRWAGPHGAHRAARRASGIVANQNEKMRGEHEGIRIGPLTGRMGRGRTSMTNARQAKARRRFRNRRFRYVTRAAGRGPEVSKRREPGGNRQSEGTKAKPRKPNDSNGFRGSNPGGEYEIRTREAVTPTRFPSVRHRPLGEFSNYATLPGVYPLSAT